MTVSVTVLLLSLIVVGMIRGRLLVGGVALQGGRAMNWWGWW